MLKETSVSYDGINLKGIVRKTRSNILELIYIYGVNTF